MELLKSSNPFKFAMWQKRNLIVASSKPSLRLRLHASAVAWLFQRHELLPGNTNMFNVVSPWKLESDFDKTTINIPNWALTPTPGFISAPV